MFTAQFDLPHNSKTNILVYFLASTSIPRWTEWLCFLYSPSYFTPGIRKFEKKCVSQIIFSFFALVVELKTSKASLLQIITGRTFPAAHASSHPTDDNDLLPFPPRLDDLVPMWSIVICSAQFTLHPPHPCHLHQPEERGACSHLTVYFPLFSPTWWWSQNIQYLNSLSL